MRKNLTLILSITLIVLLAIFFYLIKNRESEVTLIDYSPVQNSGIENEIDLGEFNGGAEINNNETNNMEVNTQTNKIKKENGLIIEVVQLGNGKEAKNNTTVSVHYTGKLEDGTVFDSSIQRGTPIEFNLGIGMVIPGWEQGILGMLVGEKRILTIPADLAYGARGITQPDGTVIIPGGATLIFDVELVDVK